MISVEIICFVLIAGIAIAVAIYQARAKQLRLAELWAAATRLGLSFRAERDPAFATGWSFLSALDCGRDRYAFNILRGEHNGEALFVFDYHYKTGAGKNTRHHYPTFILLVLHENFPALTIEPETLESRLAHAFGFEDINFESAEFSRSYSVSAKDRKFAYDVCNPQMIEFLLEHRDLHLELQGPALLLVFEDPLPAAKVEFNLWRLREIRLRLPDYLFTKA